MSLAIQARGLVKTYGEHTALDGFTLEVPTGTIHGLLGPNGAGKSTAVGILTTLTRLDGGTATVAGIDVNDGRAVRERIGLVGQYAAVDEILSGRQNLIMFGRLLGMKKKEAAARAEELLKNFALSDASDRPISGYSGGMRRRLDIAVSLITKPEVLFLDEPTTGLDPRGRIDVWNAVKDVAADGTTVLMTTQYLEEADRLADRISIMKAGQVVAEGTASELKASRGDGQIDITFPIDTDRSAVHQALGVDPSDNLRVTYPAPNGAADLTEAIRRLDNVGLIPTDIALRQPTLDEAFLSITEKDAR